MEGIEALFERNREKTDRQGIECGYLLATVSTNCFVVEPVFFWPDSMMEIHRRSVEPDHLKRLKEFPDTPEVTETVSRIRGDIAELLKDMGAVHLQIGKSYKYREGLRPESFDLVRSLKNILDPENRINPGCLGFNA